MNEQAVATNYSRIEDALYNVENAIRELEHDKQSFQSEILKLKEVQRFLIGKFVAAHDEMEDLGIIYDDDVNDDEYAYLEEME